jgi:hypothetical protein
VRRAFERANGGKRDALPDELKTFRLWCTHRGYEGWEYHNARDMSQGSVFEDWCEERRLWAQIHGGWPGDPTDTGVINLNGTSTTGAVRFSEELEEVRSGVIPDMPRSECEKYI